jgi:hypothetical protein
MGGFFCVHFRPDLSVSICNTKIFYFLSITIFFLLSFRVGHFHPLTSMLFGCHGL